MPRDQALQVSTNPDCALLEYCADWHIARATCLLGWAECDKREASAGPSCRVETSPSVGAGLQQMREVERALVEIHPLTVRGAVAVLRILQTVMLDREVDPEWTIAAAPVGQLLGSVLATLGDSDNHKLIA